jgi:multidrug efflux pump subunit AcrA (membrane-fusion protein)
MFGNLELVFTLVEDALVIPEAALQFNRDQASVVLMDGDGKAVFRDVEVGARLPGYAQIVSGLIEGDQVVVEGYQKMRPGSAILISNESDRFPADTSVQTGA